MKKFIRKNVVVFMAFLLLFTNPIFVQAKQVSENASVSDNQLVPTDITDSSAPLISEDISGVAPSENRVGSYPFICSGAEWEVLRLTNKYRMSQGLLPLSTYAEHQSVADLRASEIISNFSHTRPNGSSWETAFSDSRVNALTVAENVAAGYSTAADIANAFINSPEHRATILDSGLTHLSVGYEYRASSLYKHYWVESFSGTCTPQIISVENVSSPLTLEAGREIDSFGLSLCATCSHGTSYLPLISEMCSAVNPRQVGTPQTITVKYGNATTTFQIEIPGSSAPQSKGMCWIPRDGYYDVGIDYTCGDPNVEFQWLAYNNDTQQWFTVSDWSKSNWASWKGTRGNYWLVCNMRTSDGRQTAQDVCWGFQYGFDNFGTYANYDPDGGILLGCNSPIPGATYYFKIYNIDTDQWVWGCQQASSWTKWYPEKGNYWTHFEVYSKDGRLIGQKTHCFAVTR